MQPKWRQAKVSLTESRYGLSHSILRIFLVLSELKALHDELRKVIAELAAETAKAEPTATAGAVRGTIKAAGQQADSRFRPTSA